jgi:hypothetical protein
MLYPGLSLDQAPPLWVPARFFLTAALFGIAFGMVLVVADPAAITGRWSPTALALTHLLTLGVLGMVMCGALFQMLPVVAGSPVQRPRLIAGLVHTFLTGGTFALPLGLGMGWRLPLQLGVLLLAAGFALFLFAAGRSLWQAARAHDTVRGMRLALIALAVTVSLGIALGLGHAFDAITLWRFPLTNLHLAWGMLGWISLLLIAVAYQVVPLFQMTPDYPRWITRRLAWMLFALLLIVSLATLLPPDAARLVNHLATLLGGAAVVVFAAITLRLQQQRKRRLPDVTLEFWRLAMVSLIASVLLLVLSRVYLQPHLEWMIGVLFLVGFALSAINGMLYKIVPFLVWFHLQNQMLAAAGRGVMIKIPHMKAVLPDKRARGQYRVHLAAALTLLLSLFSPAWLLPLAGVLFAVSFGWLLLNLVTAVRLYQSKLDEITNTAA